MSAIVIPPDLTSRTTAINVMLSAIGESPITDIESNQSVDGAIADGILREIHRATCAKGYCWNREELLPLTPDDEGSITLPVNALYIGRAYWDSSSGPPADVVERGRRLYNKTDHTYVFTSPVYVDLVLLLTWEELPEYARHYITLRAAQQFQGRGQGSSLVNRITEDEVAMALATMEARDDEAARLNQVTNNAGVIRRLWGRVRRRP